MSIAPLHAATPALVPASGGPRLAPRLGGADGESFAAALRAAGGGSEDEARRGAEQLVASALVVPVLRMMRDASRVAGPFAPGDSERRFGPLLDQRLADGIVHSANFPLVERITARITGSGPKGVDHLPKTGPPVREG